MRKKLNSCIYVKKFKVFEHLIVFKHKLIIMNLLTKKRDGISSRLEMYLIYDIKQFLCIYHDLTSNLKE